MKDRITSLRKRPSPVRRKNKLPTPPLGKVKTIQPEDLSPFFDSPIDLLCIGSLEGIFQKLNPEWETTLGYPLSEMEGKDFIEFVHPDDRRETLAAFREFGRQKGVRVLTNRVRCKDGSFRWLEWKYLLRGEHIYAAARDITDRKRTEDELRESRRMLETVLNTIPARVFWKDRDLVYLGCNQSFAQDAGFRSPEEVIGKNDYQIGWADYTEEYQTDDRAVIETGNAKMNFEESAINAEGKYFWVCTSKIPLRGPQGGIRGVLGTYEDITERKQAEEEIRLLNVDLEQRVIVRTRQLEEVNQELEAFSFSVSHDLRAPLRVIDGFSHILEEDYGSSLDEEGRRVCAVIRENARQMNELIDDLLALSRLARSEMEFLSNDIETMVRSVFQELTTPESRTRIELIIHPLPRALGDPILLRQALTNLISNAIKFSAKRERARIEIGCQSSPEEDVFSIGDNGAGFDMHNINRLFGVFQRLHSAAEFEGTGVGLAIVQRVIRRHGGRVWAEGAVDKGATFYFTLPKNAAGVNSSAGN